MLTIRCLPQPAGVGADTISLGGLNDMLEPATVALGPGLSGQPSTFELTASLGRCERLVDSGEVALVVRRELTVDVENEQVDKAARISKSVSHS